MGGRVNRHLSQRRLVALLREATGLKEVEPKVPWIGATLMLDAAIGTGQRSGSPFSSRLRASCSSPSQRNSSQKPRPCIEPAGHRGSSNPWQHTPAPGRHGPTCTSPSGTPLSPSGSTRTVTSTPPSTSAAGQETTSLRSARTPPTASGRTCGPGCANANTQPPRMTSSSTRSFKRLGRRDAHLRPGIEVQRIWPWAHAADLDERGTLASEVRAAVAELLTALGEPLPPAHTEPPASCW